jgi:nucleoid-associated protein YgaU
MYVVAAAGRPRCLAVAAALTAALWGVAAVLVREVTAGPASGTAEVAIARLCLVALLVAVAWAWLQAMAGVADAWAGTAARGGVVRRLALAACVVALAGAGSASAQAAAVDVDGPRVLAGLPLPERAEGPAHRRPVDVVVRAGDCLWAVAARDLGPRATDQQIAQRWHEIYAANRAVIGPDPDLVRPGQVLRMKELQ